MKRPRLVCVVWAAGQWHRLGNVYGNQVSLSTLNGSRPYRVIGMNGYVDDRDSILLPIAVVRKMRRSLRLVWE